MSKETPWEKIIENTRKSAKAAAELSTSLYELFAALEAEAAKQQESNDNGPENPGPS